MLKRLTNLSHSLISRLIFLVGLILFVSISTWAYFNIEYQQKNAIDGIIEEVDRLGNTIKLGTHYAMMLNSRDDINEIIKNIGRQEGIENVRIYNKEGQIKYSNKPWEVDRVTSIKADACDVCHRTDPPMEEVDIRSRTRISDSSEGHRLIAIISPIYSEPGCSPGPCHVHPQDKRVLGALDVVLSLEKTDRGVIAYKTRIIALAVISFLATSAMIGTFLLIFVNRPIKKLISWTRLIAHGQFHSGMEAQRDDVIGQLALAIDQMGNRINEKQTELTRQREEYQKLFEMVPCYITVQDRNLRLLRYNREYIEKFAPRPGDHCYEAYKGRTERCEQCPVILTFEDGRPHTSEEMGVARDGTVSHWIVQTSPIRDTDGNITAVMETNLDITQMRRLEEEIRKSEEKYRVIFNNIPSAIFVIDKQDFTILDCNDGVRIGYGYSKEEVLGNSFLDLFEPTERDHYARQINTVAALIQVRQLTRGGKAIYANMRISPSEYLGQDALLITSADITKRLLAEQQLIQASKMATLGEMATGIAHELNQPLSVIKTASSFLIKKVKKEEKIKEAILQTMAEEIDSHVDRASKIINHLREFGRKSEVKKEGVQVNEALEKAVEIFSQQLKLREIEVVKDLQPDLPPIMANSNRLEQVFINLLINARDAIEEKVEKTGDRSASKKIFLKTSAQLGKVTIEIGDTGMGISPSVLDKIFEPFFTTKKVGRGTGLGLAISYGIVQDYEGTIRVETVENEGSNFIVQIPTSGEA
jgi:histidine kinase